MPTPKFSKVNHCINYLSELYQFEQNSDNIFVELKNALALESEFTLLESAKMHLAMAAVNLISPCPQSMVDVISEQKNLLVQFKAEIANDLASLGLSKEDSIPEQYYNKYVEKLQGHYSALESFFSNEDFVNRIHAFHKTMPIFNQLKQSMTQTSPYRNYVSNVGHDSPIITGIIRIPQHLTKYENILTEIFKIEDVNPELKQKLLEKFKSYAMQSQIEIELYQGTQEALALLDMAKVNYGKNLLNEPAFLSLLSMGLTQNWCHNEAVSAPKNSIKEVWLTTLLGKLLPEDFECNPENNKLFVKQGALKIIFSEGLSVGDLVRNKQIINNDSIKKILDCIPENNRYRTNPAEDLSAFLENQRQVTKHIISVAENKNSKEQLSFILAQQIDRLDITQNFAKDRMKNLNSRERAKRIDHNLETPIGNIKGDIANYKNQINSIKLELKQNDRYLQRFSETSTVTGLVSLATRKIIETIRKDKNLENNVQAVSFETRFSLNKKIASFLSCYYEKNFSSTSLIDQRYCGKVDKNFLHPALGLELSDIDYYNSLDINKFDYKALKNLYQETHDPIFLVLAMCCPIEQVEGLEYIDNKGLYQVTYHDKALDYLKLSEIFIGGQDRIGLYTSDELLISSDIARQQAVPRIVFTLMTLANDCAMNSRDRRLIGVVADQTSDTSLHGRYLLQDEFYRHYQHGLLKGEHRDKLLGKDESKKGNKIINDIRSSTSHALGFFRQQMSNIRQDVKVSWDRTFEPTSTCNEEELNDAKLVYDEESLAERFTSMFSAKK